MTRAVWFCLGLKIGVLGMAKCAVIEYLFEVSFCVCCGYSFGLDFWVSNEWWFLGFKWTVVGRVFALYRLVPVEVGGWEGKGYYYYHHFVCVVFSMSWVFSFALHSAMASLCFILLYFLANYFCLIICRSSWCLRFRSSLLRYVCFGNLLCNCLEYNCFKLWCWL